MGGRTVGKGKTTKIGQDEAADEAAIFVCRRVRAAKETGCNPVAPCGLRRFESCRLHQVLAIRADPLLWAEKHRSLGYETRRPEYQGRQPRRKLWLPW